MLLHGYEKGARWDPGFWFHHEAGWYPIHVVADAFVSCEDAARGPTLVVMSRRYRHTPQLNHSALVVEVVGLTMVLLALIWAVVEAEAGVLFLAF